MDIIDAPLFFQRDKAKELNDTIFTNTGCFVFLKTGEFPFSNCCENYRQAIYSLILDSYVLFHDYGRFFLGAFADVFNTKMPETVPNLLKYRRLLAHSHFEPDIQIMNSFARLITADNITSSEEFYVKVLNANDDDYKKAYNALKNELDTFYHALFKATGNSSKKKFCDWHRNDNKFLNTFERSLNHALIKTILQMESCSESPSYSIYCQNGNVEIKSFKTVQQVIINKFFNDPYNEPDEIYLDFRNKVIGTVKPPTQSSALLLNIP